MAVSFIDGGYRRNPPTCHKLLTNFITYYCIEYTSAEQADDRQWLYR